MGISSIKRINKQKEQIITMLAAFSESNLNSNTASQKLSDRDIQEPLLKETEVDEINFSPRKLVITKVKTKNKLSMPIQSKA